MKIICNKKEFARLVRICAKNAEEYDCKGCSFFEICAEQFGTAGDPEKFHEFCEVSEEGS